jgi:hypothetical protein
MLDPIGIDQRPFELARKYGTRDILICLVGRRGNGRWPIMAQQLMAAIIIADQRARLVTRHSVVRLGHLLWK